MALVDDGFRFRGQAANVLITLVSGVVIGVLLVTYAISFSAITFSGEFAFLLDRAIGIGLFGAAIMAAITSFTASYAGTIGGPQDVAAAVLAITIGSAAASLPENATPDQVYATAYATLAAASLLTGATFLCLGYFKLGNLVRFIPYPVMAGFLAATGWLLVKSSLGLMSGVTLEWSTLADLFDRSAMSVWIPGAALGALLLTCAWRLKQPAILPALIIGSIILFYLVLIATGITPEEARASRWLLGPFPGKGFTGSIDPTLMLQGDLVPSLRTFVEIVTVVILCVLGILLNVSGIEAATRKNVDLNRDLMSAGFSNLATGVSGGLVGYQQLSLTVLADRFGAHNRFVGLIAAAICATAFFAGAEALSFFPKAVVGGIVFFLGLDLLLGSLYREWNKLPLVDFAIIVLIFVVATTVGFLEGIAIGIVAGAVMFIITYSKIDVVRAQFLGSEFRSNVDRTKSEERVLNEEGDRTLVMELQGFIFFGTATQIYDRVRQRISEKPPKKLMQVVIDFRRVTGLDSSAVHSFVKLTQLMQDRHISLVFTGLRSSIELRFRDSEMDFSAIPGFQNLDEGIEWCEERTLDAYSDGKGPRPTTLQSYLIDDIFTRAQAKELLAYLEERHYEPGDYLLRQGAESDDVLFIEKGRVTVQLELPGGKTVRLRSMGPGTVVGEIGNYLGLPRTASVIADEPCSARRLTQKTLQKITREKPVLIATFHKFMARRLSQKLADSNRMLEALLR
ncbi:MAG: SulP family inorganic anion transporter [Hyphomicrobiaceae bacterium]|nr:SulP family inorganic anion transporter [Hyphomicrobiaceae bacterium]